MGHQLEVTSFKKAFFPLNFFQCERKQYTNFVESTRIREWFVKQKINKESRRWNQTQKRKMNSGKEQEQREKRSKICDYS